MNHDYIIIHDRDMSTLSHQLHQVRPCFTACRAHSAAKLVFSGYQAMCIEGTNLRLHSRPWLAQFRLVSLHLRPQSLGGTHVCVPQTQGTTGLDCFPLSHRRKVSIYRLTFRLPRPLTFPFPQKTLRRYVLSQSGRERQQSLSHSAWLHASQQFRKPTARPPCPRPRQYWP